MESENRKCSIFKIYGSYGGNQHNVSRMYELFMEDLRKSEKTLEEVRGNLPYQISTKKTKINTNKKDKNKEKTKI